MRSLYSFNPLPSPKQGETPVGPWSWRAISWFQSAPLTEARGDEFQRTDKGEWTQFQSAPLTEARGDTVTLSVSGARSWFQSAPLTEARGDLDKMLTHKDLGVSIRSPHRSKGRLIRHGWIGWPQMRFNPLPSPKQGETIRQFLLCRRRVVSIRSPHRSKGRRSAAPDTARTCGFQSAPLTEARGDLRGEELNSVMEQFQSAPLTEARGDLRGRS